MMSAAKHTPGPWEAQMPSRHKISVVTPDERELYIGCVPLAEAEANARLIAAAPELLAACETLLSNLRTLDDAGRSNPAAWSRDTFASQVRLLQDAIAKATGGHP